MMMKYVAALIVATITMKSMLTIFICSRCGWDAEKKVYRKTNGKRDISRCGIDPDVKLDDWEP